MPTGVGSKGDCPFPCDVSGLGGGACEFGAIVVVAGSGEIGVADAVAGFVTTAVEDVEGSALAGEGMGDWGVGGIGGYLYRLDKAPVSSQFEV